MESGADGGDVAVTAHLGDEAGVGTEGAVDAGESGLLTGNAGDPVEGGVGEDCVELVIVGQCGGIVLCQIEAAGAMQVALAGGVEHRGRGVDAEDHGSRGGELFGESAVAAAEVEDLLAGLGIEEGDDVGGEGCHEASVSGVGFGVPCLAGFGGVHASIVFLSGGIREKDKNFRRVG